MENKLLIVVLVALTLITASESWELTGNDATALTGESVNLKCQITGEDGNASLIYIWQGDNPDNILFFNETPVQADKDRMSASIKSDEMSVMITGVTLDDELTYKCVLNRIKPPVSAYVSLTVNKNPDELYVIDSDKSAVDGEVATVTECFVKGAKPKPEIWFTDEDGNDVDTAEQVEVTDNGNGLFDVSLALKKSFTKDDNNKRYKCNVLQADGQTITEETKPINVQFGTTGYLAFSSEGELKLLEENQAFRERCIADGNPYPDIEWRFVPDPETNYTMAEDQKLPENFRLSGDGRSVVSDAVSVTTGASTNNGTFICKASNGIGEPVEHSFRLGVYAAPVTTVPTTQALAEVTTKRKEATVGIEPHAAGSDAAVIGGVVAVAAFVIIVAIILIVRYFMSHKGTYHTHEMKNPSHDVDEEKMRDDDPMMDDDDDEELAGHKKRTEYFM